MNTSILLILREIAESGENSPSQRGLSESLDISLGKINALLKEAVKWEMISVENESGERMYALTDLGRGVLEMFRVDNAILLAAGLGSRFVPFTYETPKGLLEVNGQPMIERQIEQLHQVGITDITIVVGYLKEKFDYLIDKYGVSLVFNPEYAKKNNFVSVYYALDRLKNTYLLVSDHYIENNMFREWEPYSWLSCSYFTGPTNEWGVKTGARDRITRIDTTGKDEWALNGPAFFMGETSARFAALIKEAYSKPGTDNYYWEDILAENLSDLEIYINRQPAGNVREFENLEELRDFDVSYADETGNTIMRMIAETFGVPQSEITGIQPLKEGMTNQSFVFHVGGESYVFRLPGAGTEALISRGAEKRNYELVAPLELSDELIHFDEKTGIKISRYYDGARVVNAENDDELKRAMELLAKMHGAGIKSDHSFDIAERIDFYEILADGLNAIRFSDYHEVREKANELLAFKERLAIPETLCHIDYVYANILWLPDGSVRVIDWEYSGAADPIIDVAMFSIYSYFTRERADKALSFYLARPPTGEETARLYMYIALAGFLWAIWCQYKQGLGEEFGEYPLIQYRYMKDFYRILKEGGHLDEQHSRDGQNSGS